ncbi:hypothetical protein PRIPAC_71351 [Pristionchus pacificus]|uniref:Uncharacterized protein n=1 Tax=Pristionchus pacificus TaxID=54126 RepID=A0A2A6B570_PRIPA|nr:hypothetical protein PRIPAC_71351 [Pristionchus pacificus]|eukprot:PDM61008.1 hypothetical protein PRIPAC_54814 [Pristionchus pacificus]
MPPPKTKSPESSNTSASRKRGKSPAREGPSSKTRSKHAENKNKASKARKEEMKARDLKYVAVKKEASDEAINLKKILKAEREEMPEIRKRGPISSFVPVHFPAGRIYRPGVLEKTIPRTMNRHKTPRKYTGVTKAIKTANSKTASKSNSNECKSGGRKIKTSVTSRSKKAGKR